MTGQKTNQEVYNAAFAKTNNTDLIDAATFNKIAANVAAAEENSSVKGVGLYFDEPKALTVQGIGTANVGLGTKIGTPIDFTQIRYDTEEVFNTAEPTKIKVPKSFTAIQLHGTLFWRLTSASVNWGLQIIKNRTDIVSATFQFRDSPSRYLNINTAIISALPGDEFEMCLAYFSTGTIEFDALVSPQAAGALLVPPPIPPKGRFSAQFFRWPT